VSPQSRSDGRRTAHAREAALRPGALAAATGAFAGLALVLWWPPWLTNDALWALVWGGEILDGGKPSFEEPGSSTPHPLTNLMATAAQLLGTTGAYWALAVLAGVAFSAIVVLTFAVGALALGPAAGVVAAALVATTPALVEAGRGGSMNLLFVAFTLLAVYRELAGARARRVMALLALAGLVRPEAWLIAGAYWVFLLFSGRDRSIWTLIVAASAPVIWLLVDAAVTGNPVHSLTHTQEGARALRRVTGAANVPSTAGYGLRELLSAAVLLGGTVGFLAAGACRRAWPLLAVGLLGGVAYAAIGVAGLSLLERYLILPAIVLTLTFGYAVTGWLGRQGVRRFVWMGAAALLVAYALTAVAGRAETLGTVDDRAEANAALVSYLRALGGRPVTRRALQRCGRVVVRDQRPRALLINELGQPVPRVVDGRRVAADENDLFVTLNQRALAADQYALFPASPVPAAADAPARFRVVHVEGPWEVRAGPACR
jgi:hypothetical protein